MTKTLTYLIVLHGCFLLSHSVSGQCGYKTTIHTNNNYCVGSSLIVTSIHAMQKITWYRNGQPVSAATGVQSLSTRYTPVPIFQNPDAYSAPYDYTHIVSDNAGNIYCLYAQHLLLKATPAGQLSQIADFSTVPGAGDISDLAIDAAGNIYVSSADFGPNATPVWKIPVGTISVDTGSLVVAVPASANPLFNYSPAADFVDCNDNLYVYCPGIRSVYRYSPGAVSAKVLGAFTGTPSLCGSLAEGNLHVDAAGNAFFLLANTLMKLSPGSTTPATVFSVSCASENIYCGDFWMDANDTVYLSVLDLTHNTGLVQKWAPGASSGTQVASYPMNNMDALIDPITMDVRGNIWVAYGGSPDLYEFKRATSIDSAFTPTDTGSYYAVVTDIQGYTATSDTFHVNAPATVPPSIQITATADSTPVCTPVTFTAAADNPGPGASYQWMVSGVPVGGDSTTYGNNMFADGDEVYCILMAEDGCAGPVADTSNIVRMGINPEGAASVTINAAPRTSICTGQAISFAATVMNGTANPVFEWLVNGDSTGDVNSSFMRSNFSNDDVVTCLIVSDDACGLAKSNSIPLTVSIPPVIQPGQIFTIPRGGSLTLDPVISGSVNTWAWSPGAWLSDSTIQGPVADPPATITYTLMVEANGGCGDTATVLVDVFTPLALPNAFTPNGDGRNDRFYVLGGPVNSVVETFDVFNRWGQAVFRAYDAAPGDASAGWDGRVNGSPASPGTYVYVVVMRFATGTRQTYKGTVEVIR
jgi:gliding motility-associated-like protein